MKHIKHVLALLLALALLLSCACAEELATGAKGEAVERLQKRLYYLGFLSIQPDGDYGPKTVEAVTDFQTFVRARGYQLRADGVADAATQALLFSDEVADADYPLKQGDSNGYVRRAQRRLIELGYLFGAADGDYGQNTTDAVRAFQREFGLPVTGAVDQATWDAVALTYLSLAADIAGGEKGASTFIRECQTVKFVPSLAGVSTTISYPAKTSHRAYTPEEMKAVGISMGQLRFSIGLENIDDVLEEFDNALKKV